MKKEEKISRAQRSEQVKEHIHRCALSLFDQKGYDQTTVQDIAEAAQVSVGSIYHFYKNKADIARFPFQKLDKKYQQLYSQLCNDGPKRPAADLLLDYYIGVQTYGAGEGRFSFALTYVNAIRYPEQRTVLVTKDRAHYQIQRELILRCQAEGSISHEWSVDQVCRQLLIVSRGLYMCWITELDDFEIEKESRNAFSLLLSSLKSYNA